MEREGLFRSIQFMQQEGLEIEMLVTDRHVQIAKWMRENQPRIRHRYDVWHVAKSKLTANVGTSAFLSKTTKVLIHFLGIGVRKKLQALGKQKECQLVTEWTKSIINHLYWCVASTPNAESDIIKAKWLSLKNHVHNIHEGHGTHFPKCAHSRLHGHRQRRKWFRQSKYSLIHPSNAENFIELELGLQDTNIHLSFLLSKVTVYLVYRDSQC